MDNEQGVDGATTQSGTIAASAPETAAVVAPELQKIEDWFNAYVANSPVSRNQEAINHMLTTAMPALRKAFEA